MEFLFWVSVAGGFGGLIYSLSTGDTHSLRLPFYRRQNKGIDIETGFLGHILIGAFSGIVLLSLVMT